MHALQIIFPFLGKIIARHEDTAHHACIFFKQNSQNCISSKKSNIWPLEIEHIIAVLRLERSKDTFSS